MSLEKCDRQTGRQTMKKSPYLAAAHAGDAKDQSHGVFIKYLAFLSRNMFWIIIPQLSLQGNNYICVEKNLYNLVCQSDW